MNNRPEFIVIRPLSIPSNSASLHSLTKRRGNRSNLIIPDGISDFVHTAQKLAVQDLLTVIAHVTTLFSGEFAEKEGLISRLNKLAAAVHQVESGVWQHGFPCDRHYEEYEELCSLESELIGFSNYDYWGDGSESVLLSSLIVYWLDEIKCRGYDLFNLLIGAVLHDEVTASFLALQQISYPSKNV